VTLSSFLTTAVSPVTWLAVGMFLIGISLIAPNPLTAALGFAGLVTALVALSVPVLAKQLFIWGILSGAMVLIFFGLTPQRPATAFSSTRANILVPIPAGGMGQVSCDGVQWNARCQISDVAIGSGQTVDVIGRQGNTLIVLPNPPRAGHTVKQNI
jgi:membrane protein implicated in regulation of membrane protease activity